MLRLEYKDYQLQFKFEAGTSRGILKTHHIMVLKISDSSDPSRYGLGEAAPLKNLSPERFDELDDELQKIQKRISGMQLPSTDQVYGFVHHLVSEDFPSLTFALETALFDLINGGRKAIFENEFHQGDKHIPINGLIWMGEPDFMKSQIDEKLEKGFKCIKLKVGAIDFKKELEVLSYLRSQSQDITIRIDANGGFKTNEVFRKLDEMSSLNIHSIEQPIMPGQWEAMQLICQKSPIPIALDEELIGIQDFSRKMELLKYLQPQYVILKPTLLGGFKGTEEWIQLAKEQGIRWWMTSALESSIGLNAIAQFASRFEDVGYQGLGTGQLYKNNFGSPLEIIGEYLTYNTSKPWEIGLFN